MVDKITSWKFTEEFQEEPEVIARARARADELGIESVTPSVGAQLAMLVNLTNAKAVVEVGTGAGVSGLWLLSGNDQVVLASIETEAEYQNQAKLAFSQAGIPGNRLRLINGKSTEVLANLAENTYELVLLDGDRESLIEQVGLGLRLIRPGGVLVLPHALWRDRVPDTNMQDDNTETFREVLELVKRSSEYFVTLSPVGDGLLLVSRKSA